MYAALCTELTALYRFAKRNYGPLVVMSLSTLVLMLFRYHHTGRLWLDYVLYFALMPLLAIVLLLRRNPLDFGLRLGDAKVWGFHLLVACPVIFLLVYLGTGTTAVQRYYHSPGFDPVAYVIRAAINLWCWEFLFRGFMLFGLKDKFREGAIIVQMIPFALMHLGKPETETISCIISGVYFGYVCYRTRSFWPAYLLHLFINYSTKFLTVYS